MKLYRTVISDKDEGTCYTWHGGYNIALRELRRLQRERNNGGGVPLGPEHVESIEISVGKKALIQWLNANFTRDNG